MKRADKELWLQHLRSGKYNQITGHLRTQEGYCCLGILCEARGIKPVFIEEVGENIETGKSVPPHYEYMGQRDVLPVHLAMEMLHGAQNPAIKFPERVFRDQRESPYASVEEMSLAEMNDEGFTFSQIADMIEYFIPAED